MLVQRVEFQFVRGTIPTRNSLKRNPASGGKEAELAGSRQGLACAKVGFLVFLSCGLGRAGQKSRLN